MRALILAYAAVAAAGGIIDAGRQPAAPVPPAPCCRLKAGAPPPYKSVCNDAQTQQQCEKLNMTCQWVAPPPPATSSCHIRPGKPKVYEQMCNASATEAKCDTLNLTCYWGPPPPSPGPSAPCTAAMRQACGNATTSNDCFMCMGKHQASLGAAGCNSTDYHQFCESVGPPPPPPPQPPNATCTAAMQKACGSQAKGALCFLCMGADQPALHAANCTSTDFHNFCNASGPGPAPPPPPSPPSPPSPPPGVLCCTEFCQQPNSNCWCEEWGCNVCLAANQSSCEVPPVKGGCCQIYTGHNQPAPCLNPNQCGSCRGSHNCHAGGQDCPC